jgi:hypothetical protein
MATAYIKIAKAVASARLGGVLDKGFFAMFGRGNKLFEDGYGDIDEVLRMLQHIAGACYVLQYWTLDTSAIPGLSSALTASNRQQRVRFFSEVRVQQVS